MGEFSTSFCITLFHSIWQSAILYLLAGALNIFTKQSPLSKRNLLYSLVLLQIVFSCCTFFLNYQTGGEKFSSFYFSLPGAESPLFELISQWLLASYFLIAIYKLSRFAKGWYLFKSRISDQIKAPVELRLFTSEKATSFGLNRKVSLWLSNSITTPLTYGFLKPVILLPVALVNQLSLKEAESLIIHELNHIRNNDYLLNFCLVFAETIFFFNPFVRKMIDEIRIEREKDCDLRVLDFRYPSLIYAETLLKVSKLRMPSSKLLIAAVSKNNHLLKRITFFTDERNMLFSKKNYAFLCLPVAIAILLINLFLIPDLRNSKEFGKLYFADNTIQKNKKTTENKFSSVNTTSLYTTANEKTQPKKKSTGKIQHVAKSNLNLHDNINTQANDQVIENYAIPAAVVETDATKQIMISEENSSGQSVTKSYTLKFENGQWKAELLWVIRATKPVICDSLVPLKDSLIQLSTIVQ